MSHRLQFTDTARLMASSLSNFINNLPKGSHKFKCKYWYLCLHLWIYGWLEKIQWTIITWKRRFLQSLKYGRNYWCRLPHTKIVWKDFEIKNIGEYYDFNVQSDTLLLADVFKNFRNNCFKIYELVTTALHFLLQQD